MKLNISRSIRQLRRTQCITQEMLAEALGVTPQAVSRWESGATYPDMELIPAIANYFGVSIDRLFGYDGTREAKITAVLDEVNRLNDESWRSDAHMDECLALLRRALEEFPDNERLMDRLAHLLMQAGWTRCHEQMIVGQDGHLHADTEHHRKNPYWAEAIALYEKLSANAEDHGLRYSAVNDLVLLYRMVGQNDRAKALADSMPAVFCCKESLLACAADGEEKTARHAEAALSLLRTFREHYMQALLNDPSNFGTAMPIEKVRGLIDLYGMVFNDGNLGPQHAAVCDLYLYLSRLQWEYGDKDEAFRSLDAALDHARRFDALTAGDRYTAPVVCSAQLVLPAVKPGGLARSLPGDWPMWNIPDPTEAVAQIKSDPRWLAWAARTQE